MMTNLVIPPESTYTDIERDLIDNEPPGLFPGDQVSVWGQVRKVYADYMQYNLADVLGQWYLNLDPRTVAPEDLPEWEYMLDTPANDALSYAARQSFLISRREQGAFTRARRARLVESFITATFGPATDFTPDGIPIDSAGIPLYSGATSLAGTYRIVENVGGVNLISPQNGSMETDVSGWSPGAPNTFVRDTTRSRFGVASGKYTVVNAPTGWCFTPYVVLSGATAGRVYTGSVYVYGEGSILGKQVGLCMREQGGAQPNYDVTAYVTMVPGWQRIVCTRTIVENDRTYVAPYLQFGGAIAGDYTFADGFQIELGSTANAYTDPASNPFSYDVRILNTITIDTAGLTRELKRITPSGISFTITPTATP